MTRTLVGRLTPKFMVEGFSYQCKGQSSVTSVDLPTPLVLKVFAGPTIYTSSSVRDRRTETNRSDRF